MMTWMKSHFKIPQLEVAFVYSMPQQLYSGWHPNFGTKVLESMSRFHFSSSALIAKTRIKYPASSIFQWKADDSVDRQPRPSLKHDGLHAWPFVVSWLMMGFWSTVFFPNGTWSQS
jgi:hypothetical protein